MKSPITTAGKLFISLGFMISSLLLLSSCGDEQSKSNLRNQFRNDLESYDGWQGITGYYYLKNVDAHSGQHSLQTDSTNIYSITFTKNISELSENPVRKITVSLWVKCLSVPASGSYIVSIEQGSQTYKYFSFDLKEKDAIANEWMQMTGLAEIPAGLPKDAVVKIYFWNKSKSVILVDDFEFTIEN